MNFIMRQFGFKLKEEITKQQIIKLINKILGNGILSSKIENEENLENKALWWIRLIGKHYCGYLEKALGIEKYKLNLEVINIYYLLQQNMLNEFIDYDGGIKRNQDRIGYYQKKVVYIKKIMEFQQIHKIIYEYLADEEQLRNEYDKMKIAMWNYYYSFFGASLKLEYFSNNSQLQVIITELTKLGEKHDRLQLKAQMNAYSQSEITIGTKIQMFNKAVLQLEGVVMDILDEVKVFQTNTTAVSAYSFWGSSKVTTDESQTLAEDYKEYLNFTDAELDESSDEQERVMKQNERFENLKRNYMV